VVPISARRAEHEHAQRRRAVEFQRAGGWQRRLAQRRHDLDAGNILGGHRAVEHDEEGIRIQAALHACGIEVRAAEMCRRSADDFGAQNGIKLGEAPLRRGGGPAQSKLGR
jgi:hypothetical protein